VIRGALERNRPMVEALAQKLLEARRRLDRQTRKPRPQAPAVQAVFELAAKTEGHIPAELTLTPGQSTTLRGELGRVLKYYNQASQGAFLTAAADLYASTSVNTIGQGFPEGWYNAATNPWARMLVTGGICEDAMCGILAGLSTYGRHLGSDPPMALSSPLSARRARLHAIGNQARQTIVQEPYKPFILICAMWGLNRRGWADACRPSGAAASAGKFSPRYDDHPHPWIPRRSGPSCRRLW